MTGEEFKKHLDAVGWTVRQAEQRWRWPEGSLSRMIESSHPMPRGAVTWAIAVSAVIQALPTPEPHR